MEDFLYAYNQPKKFGKYDLILDGKIIANEVVYKVLTEDNEIENINLADKVKELESRLQTHFTFETVTELPTEGKETVIYLVANDEESGDKDSYNEYMWVKEKGGFELIGSGTYAQQKADLQAEIDRASAAETVLTDNLAKEVTDRTDADTALNTKIEAETERATEAEEVLTDNLAQEVTDRTDADTALDEKIDKEIEDRTDTDTLIRETVTSITGYPFEKITGDTLSISDELAKRVPYTLHKSVDVVGNIKDVVKLDVPESSNEAMYCPQGLIMGGTALAAGLVTRGICGSGEPWADGHCTKDNLYINYDGTNTYYDPYRQVIIQAGEIGEHYGHNLYQYAAARGDAVKGYVDEKIENRVVINDPITITEGDNTTSITSDTISTTTLTGTLDAESMKNSLTAEAIKAVVPIAWDGNNLPSKNGTQSISIGSGAESNGGYAVTIGNGAHGDSYMDVCIGYNSNTQHNYSVVIGGMLSTDGVSYINTRTNAPQSIAIGNGAQILNGTDANGTTVQSSNSVAIGTGAVCNNLDSVVIGANAQNKNSSNDSKTGIAIGAGACVLGGGSNVAIGTNASARGVDVSIGCDTQATGGFSVAVGARAINNGAQKTTLLGAEAKITNTTATDGSITRSENSTVIGYGTKASAPLTLTFGSSFSDTEGSYTCSTEGTGSITIGAGANTLNSTITDSEGNETTVDSSNSITIGCKASNMRADSVVIGARAKLERGDFPSVAIGSRAICAGSGNNVAIGNLSVSSGSDTNVGHNAQVYGGHCVGIGANVSNDICAKSVVIGSAAKITNTTEADGTVTKSENTTVIGYGAAASAPNAVVLGAGASTAGAGTIIIGAGTRLAAGSGNITNAILIGTGAKSAGEWARGSIALGANSTVLGDAAYAIGSGSEARTGGTAIGPGAKSSEYATALGYQCVNRNNGTMSFRQQKSVGETYT